MVWIELPTNPLLKVINIKEVSKICKQHNIILIVDNTFLTPYLHRPLELGADIVVYSLTKYMNGHSDVVMGSIATNNEEHYKSLLFLQNCENFQYLYSYFIPLLKFSHFKIRQHKKSVIYLKFFIYSFGNYTSSI